MALCSRQWVGRQPWSTTRTQWRVGQQNSPLTTQRRESAKVLSRLKPVHRQLMVKTPRKSRLVAQAAATPAVSNPDADHGFQLVQNWSTANLRGDIYGGVTTAVVALPLALAFGVASGAGPLAGLYGSIFVGFFAALFGGTPAQVTGPTGPMTVVMAVVISQFKNYPGVAFSVVMLAGLMQIGMGMLRLGNYVRLVPLPVVSGFMTGIGCIILMTQSAALFGHLPPPNALVALTALPAAVQHPNLQAMALGFLSLSLALFSPKAVTRIIPGSLLALIIGTLAATVSGADVPILGYIPSGLPIPKPPSFPPQLLATMGQSALILATLGAIDSLLTSLVADSITGTYHDSDRELIGQGIGNAVSGVFGGVASAGATMRTVVNVRAGGRTPISGALHSVILLIAVMGGGRLAERIPLAVLAGILVKCGLDVMDVAYLKRCRKLPASSVLVMAVTLGLTVFVDLIQAVAVGCVLSALIFVRDMATLQVEGCIVMTGVTLREGGRRSAAGLTAEEATALSQGGPNMALAHLQGVFTFGGANGIIRRVLPELERVKALVLDLSRVRWLDDTAALAIEEMLNRAAKLNKKFFVCGANRACAEMLDRLGITAKLPMPPSLDRIICLQAAQLAATEKEKTASFRSSEE